MVDAWSRKGARRVLGQYDAFYMGWGAPKFNTAWELSKEIGSVRNN